MAYVPTPWLPQSHLRADDGKLVGQVNIDKQTNKQLRKQTYKQANIILCRYIDSDGRPSFIQLVGDLTRLEALVLSIPQKLVEQHPQCAELGAPLNLGKLMYRNIQTMYVVGAGAAGGGGGEDGGSPGNAESNTQATTTEAR